MEVRFRFTELKVRGFRGIRDLTLALPEGLPTYLVGTNNSGKSTVLNALAFALRGGGYHTFSPAQHDFFHDRDGNPVEDFSIDLKLEAAPGCSLPAVQGVGNPEPVHGVRVLGRSIKNGFEHRHVLVDAAGDAILISPRTALKGAAKERFQEQKQLGWARYYGRLDDIREYLPEVWLLTPENLNRSLYVWQTGPLQRLARLLTERFLSSPWSFEYDGKVRKMPESLEAAHRFFRACVPEFPFWKDELKPQLEGALATYLGRSATFGLQPDILVLESWLQQQLAVSFSAESGGPLVPLPSMGDGWQALVRLAALDVLKSYATGVPTPTMLLCEEPEVYLHPHLKRKLRGVLASLSEKGWIVVSATHAAEFVSFQEPQQIVRLWRTEVGTTRGHLLTADLSDGTKFQARLDERGNHELVLANRVVLCEGKDDVFALRTYLEKAGADLDGKGVTILDVGGCNTQPDYARMSKSLGIPWCALTDEDLLPDGSVQATTHAARQQLAGEETSADLMPVWKGSLETCLEKDEGKATPEWQAINLAPLTLSAIESAFPEYVKVCSQIMAWIES